MRLRFNQEELDFQAQVRGFVDQHWPRSVRRPRSVASTYVATRRPEQQAWFDALVARGWSVPDWPTAYGGAGWTPTQRFIFDRETAQAETPLMDVFGITMLGPVLCQWGTEAQKREYLPAIREARVRWCQGYSEPGAGSDLASLTTGAERTADGYLVNGAKTWTSGAHIADWMFCLVRTDPGAARPQEGISLLLIDMTSAGVEVAPIVTLGGQHTVNSVTLNNVRVPLANRVGEENRGWTCAKTLLGHERAGVARVAQSQVQLQRLKQIASQTPVDGATVADAPAFVRKVHELEIELLGLEALELRALAAAAAGQAPGPESSILKIKGTEIGQRIGELIVEAFGYYALPYPDELLIDNEGAIGHDYALAAMQGLLFSRSWSIYGGANDAGATEVQKNIIAKSVLGLTA